MHREFWGKNGVVEYHKGELTFNSHPTAALELHLRKTVSNFFCLVVVLVLKGHFPRHLRRICFRSFFTFDSGLRSRFAVCLKIVFTHVHLLLVGFQFVNRQ